jgi:flagellar biosynthesis anti-sigma factor FlgM
LRNCEGLIKTNSVNIAERAAVESRLPQISDAVPDAPEVDVSKIEAVRDALSRGTYEIDPRRIADELLRRNSILRQKP